MPAHYIAQANREKLGMSGMDKIVAFDQSHSPDDFMALPDANGAGTSGENRAVTLRSRIWKNRLYFNQLCVGMVRSERSQLIAMRLISFSFLPPEHLVYPSLYLTLYPRAEPHEQSSIPSLSTAQHCRHDRLCLRMFPIPSSAQST
jgi:hypothetical protein